MQTKQHLQLKHHLLQDKTHKLTFSNVVAEIWKSLCLVTDLFVKGEGRHHGEQHHQNGCEQSECNRASYVSTELAVNIADFGPADVTITL